MTARLSHPGIVPTHERGIDDAGRCSFTTPLIEGVEFEEVLEHVRSEGAEWTRAQAPQVLVKVCDTMAFAHSRGVLHRDLKPSNDRIGCFGEVYAMDWGLARDTERGETRDLRLDDRREQDAPDLPLLTMDGDVIGTSASMSPERAGQVDALGARTDVYRTGAMRYHLLAGLAPYEQGDPAAPRSVLRELLAGPRSWSVRADRHRRSGCLMTMLARPRISGSIGPMWVLSLPV